MRTRAYEQYIRSEEWAAKKQGYRQSKLPQACLSCGETRIDMHHRTYKRFQAERLVDLEPLCRTCHDAGHDLIRRLNSGRAKKIRKLNLGRRLRRIRIGRFSGLLPKGWEPPRTWGMSVPDIYANRRAARVKRRSEAVRPLVGRETP